MNYIFKATLFTLVAISTVYFSSATAAATAEPRSIIESPVLKQVEYKKALFYNRKPTPAPVTTYPGKYVPDGKKVTKVRRVIPPSKSAATTIRSTSTEDGSTASKNVKVVNKHVATSPKTTSVSGSDTTVVHSSKSGAGSVAATPVSNPGELVNTTTPSVTPSATNTTTGGNSNEAQAQAPVQIQPTQTQSQSSTPTQTQPQTLSQTPAQTQTQTQTPTPAQIQNEMVASDRISPGFMPPYKMPFWGLPYGIYSNGGFINPGLFPFVPGGIIKCGICS